MCVTILKSSKTKVQPEDNNGLILEVLIDYNKLKWIESEFGKSEALGLLGKTLYNEIFKE
jgi:hypothetical protein